uniref:Uncharacterized protein n=1 Tax=Arundo donax TaxID=35708 RepID=A0A0A9AZL8_ARUDO
MSVPTYISLDDTSSVSSEERSITSSLESSIAY